MVPVFKKKKSLWKTNIWSNNCKIFTFFCFHPSLKCLIFAVSHPPKKEDCLSPYVMLLIKILILRKSKIHKHACDCEFKFDAFLRCHLLSIYSQSFYWVLIKETDLESGQEEVLWDSKLRHDDIYLFPPFI